MVTPRSTRVLNPCTETPTRYTPGSTFGKVYSPCGPAVVDMERPVSSFTTSTLADGTTAPDGSVILPTIVPVV